MLLVFCSRREEGETDKRLTELAEEIVNIEATAGK
jgi:hypothetical protein